MVQFLWAQPVYYLFNIGIVSWVMFCRQFSTLPHLKATYFSIQFNLLDKQGLEATYKLLNSDWDNKQYSTSHEINSIKPD